MSLILSAPFSAAVSPVKSDCRLPNLAAMPAWAFRITISGIESHLHLAAICKTFDPERDYQSFYSAI